MVVVGVNERLERLGVDFYKNQGQALMSRCVHVTNQSWLPGLQ